MASNPLDFLKAIQGLQRNMGDMEEKLRGVQVTGSAGGDMVEVVLNGHLAVVALRIAPEVIDREEREMLEDLIRAAFTDAVGKVKEHLRGGVQFRDSAACRCLRGCSEPDRPRTVHDQSRPGHHGVGQAARPWAARARRGSPTTCCGPTPSYVRSLAADLTALRERIRPCMT